MAEPSTWVFSKVEGIDWQASYDFDLGDLALEYRHYGTYYLHRYSLLTPGSTITDAFHQTISPLGGIPQNGVETLPRMKVPGTAGLEQRRLERDRLRELRSTLLSHAIGATECQQSMLDDGRTVGGGRCHAPYSATPTSSRPGTRSISRSATTPAIRPPMSI